MKAVAAMLKVPPIHTTSIPGVPQTNSIAESRVKIVVRGIRVMLLSAGLPSCYWPFDAKCYAFMRTIVRNGEDSIFAKRHNGEHFTGPSVPFGSLIWAMPSAINGRRRKKFEHTMPGCKWYREFQYVFLDDPADVSFYR